MDFIGIIAIRLFTVFAIIGILPKMRKAAAIVLINLSLLGCSTISRAPASEARPMSRPARPEGLRSSGEPREITFKNMRGDGKRYCRTLTKALAMGDLGLPACRRALDLAKNASVEICKGEEFQGVSDFSGIELVTLNIAYINIAADQFGKALFACRHPLSAVANAVAVSARDTEDSYFRISDDVPGEFQKLVGANSPSNEVRKLWSSWAQFARSLFDFLRISP